MAASGRLRSSGTSGSCRRKPYGNRIESQRNQLCASSRCMAVSNAPRTHQDRLQRVFLTGWLYCCGLIRRKPRQRPFKPSEGVSATDLG